MFTALDFRCFIPINKEKNTYHFWRIKASTKICRHRKWVKMRLILVNKRRLTGHAADGNKHFYFDHNLTN